MSYNKFVNIVKKNSCIEKKNILLLYKNDTSKNC